MHKPSIAVLTSDPQWKSELSEILQGVVFHWCRQPIELGADGTDCPRPTAFIADLTVVSSGGHAEVAMLDELQERMPDLPVVLVTGPDCPEPLARRAACSEWIHTPASRDAAAIRETLSVILDWSDETEDDTAGRVDAPHCHAYESMSIQGETRGYETRSLSMKLVLQELEMAAGHDVTILLIGETGVGKTYLARLIHEISPRRHEPFLTVACGALPDDLIESELFGHKQGAFTSAHADKEGKFVAAQAGTILLDEIDVLGLEQQVKLLRVIETGEFEPIGSNQTLKSQARLVVASNLKLEPLVEEGKFRADLYYRLNMLKFEIPSLRERKEDIPGLADKFIRQHAERHGVDVSRIEPAVYRTLEAYDWPGNVREMENVLRRAVIYCRDGLLGAQHLPPNVRNPQTATHKESPVAVAQSAGVPAASASLGDRIEDTERGIIERALRENNFSRTKTAKSLGISRVTLYNKMRKYEIEC